MCKETLYSFTDPTCTCGKSYVVTCPRVGAPRRDFIELLKCPEWVTRYDMLAGRCRESEKCKEE